MVLSKEKPFPWCVLIPVSHAFQICVATDLSPSTIHARFSAYRPLSTTEQQARDEKELLERNKVSSIPTLSSPRDPVVQKVDSSV